MEGVAKLVEEGLHLAQAQQGGSVVGGLAEVHHQRDVGAHVGAVLLDPLALVLRHPGAAALALARIEIDEEHGQVAAVAVIDLVGAHVGVIDGDLLVLAEGDAVEARGQSEDALDDIFTSK